MFDVCKTYKAGTVVDILRILSETEGVTLVAGGTDVMIRMRERKLKEANLLSILDVDELKGIFLDDDENIVIGAGTCFSEIACNPIVRERTPVLASAVRQVGSPQIRNIATIGGNLCNGAVSADSAPALLALDAILVLESRDGERQVPASGFHTGPGKTVRRRDELLTKIIIPRENYENYGAHYIKFGQRNAMEISTLGCAVNLRLDHKKRSVEDIKIAYGVAAPTPVRCYKTEKILAGRECNEEFLRILRSHVLEELQPRDSWRASKELRLQLIKELGCRAAKQAFINAGGGYVD